MKNFRGTYTIMVTPFDAEGGLDLAALERYVEWQIQAGIHGLIPLGSTGEFLSLSDAEYEQVADTVVRCAAGRVPVIIGTTAEDSRIARQRSQLAERLGADGVMVLPPFYCTPSDAEVLTHYRTISDAIDIPIMVYNNPAVTNIDLRPELVAQLATIDNCRYIKESTMDVTRIRDIHQLSDGRMQVFGGVMGYESYMEGAVGWAAVPSNGAPTAMARIYDCVQQGDFLGARELAFRYTPMLRFVGGQAYVAGTKALLCEMGLDVGAPRPPRLPLDAAGRQRARALVEQLDLRIPPSL